ncbi:ComEC/Rec2 family competence protein [Postechiella marina]|uniref:ComEC/Rec2 family competence protein n=1 Tax=Postechiella marina TaxID=943941 RepID=A0ABP8CE42_9FLAO
MKLINFTLIKLTLFLVIGITIGYLFSIPNITSFLITSVLLIALSICFFIAKKQFSKNIWFGIISYLLLISIGILSVNCHNQKRFTYHYSNNLTPNKDSLNTITFKIRTLLKPNNYYNKYIVNVLKIDNKRASGKLLLNIKKDSLFNTLDTDDIFTAKTTLKSIYPPLNPGQFNYKKYLREKYIYDQITTTNTSLLKLNAKHTTLFGIANNIRKYINKKLKPYNFKPDEIAIINALLLGQRQDVSEDIYNNYTNAGAIHILAISGLHIGILLMLLNIIFKPIEQFKNGRLIKTILIVIILWSFALIAGLSASVTRAVTMFSIVSIGMNLKRPTNIFNTLALSMLVLLLIKPLFLLDVGFQLSYMAVFAIVIIDPLLYKLWQPKNKILNFYWHTLTVTTSAQLGLLPLSLYYFHQIPSLFFISNLVIIPLLGLLLGLGIIVIALASINSLPQFLASTFGWLIGLMNTFIEWVAHQNTFLIKNISFNLLYILSAYILLAGIINFWTNKSIKSLKFALLGIIFLQSTIIYTNYNKPKNQLIIFHKNRFSLIGNISKNKIYLANDFDSITQSKSRTATNFIVKNHIKNHKKDSLKHLYLLNKKKLLIIDSLSSYNVKSFTPDYILLRQSPKVNLNRLIDSIKPKHIIADGSNYKSYLTRWEAVCKKRKIPFHPTGKKGAFIIDY